MDCSSKEKSPVLYCNRVNELGWSCACSRLPGLSASLAELAPVRLHSTAGTHRLLAGGDWLGAPPEPRPGARLGAFLRKPFPLGFKSE